MTPRRAKAYRWGSRLSALGAAGVIAAATLLTLPLGGSPASATPASPVTIAVGQTITKTYPAIAGQMGPGHLVAGEVSLQAGTDPPPQTWPYPETCADPTAVGCVTIPVKLAVSQKDIATHQYVFGATITWDNGFVVGGLEGNTQGLITNAQLDNLSTYIWNIPHGVGTDGTHATGYAAHGEFSVAPPMGLSDVTIKTPDVAVVVENYAGVNKGFTVTYSLVDASGGPGADLSIQNNGSIVDKSAVPVGSVTPSATTPPPVTTPTTIAPLAGVTSPEGGTTLGQVQIASDPQLDGLVPVDDSAALAAGPAKHIGKIRKALGPATPVTGAKAAIWLVAVPVALILLAVAFLLRWRRRSEGIDV